MALGAWAPASVPLVLAALVGLLLLVLGYARPDLYLPAALLGAAAILGSQEGLQPPELLYFAYLSTFLVAWYAWWFLTGTARLRSSQDLFTAGTIVLGGLGGVTLGLLFGAPITGIRNDLVGFFPLLLYFPVREAVAGSPRGAHYVSMALLGLSLVTAALVLWELYSTVISATAAWEIIDVRVTGYEIPLLIGSVASLAAVAYSEQAYKRMVALGLSVLLLIFLFITKSRGYWIGWAFAVGLLFLFLPSTRRRTLLRWGAAGAFFGAVALFLIAGEVAIAFAIGIVNRFSTLASAFTTDVSLLNRYVETDALWNRISRNPILGHGFGTEFSYNDLTLQGRRTWAYAHNGFAGLWFKLGVWGFCLIIGWWLHAAWEGFVASRSRALSPIERGYGLGASTALLGVLLTTYTSGIYFVDAQILLITVTVALASGLRLRSQTLIGTREE